MYRRLEAAYAKAALASESICSSQKGPSVYDLLKPQGANDPIGHHERVLMIWENSSLAMQQILKQRGIPYLEIVQPNQYYTEKEFSPEERAIAVSEHSPYRRAMEQGYPLVEEWIAGARTRGLNIVSAIHIFDDVTTPLFSDNACHYNQTGNEILARFIADQMLLQLRTEREAGLRLDNRMGHDK
jgi:hypothetical protein